MKVFYIVLFLVTGLKASTLTLFCDERGTPESCGNRIHTVLSKVGCKINTNQTKCDFSLEQDPNNPEAIIATDQSFCEVTSVNCSSPRTGNFGGETCLEGEKLTIPKADKVHNGYWLGIFKNYSRTVCRTTVSN